MSIKELVGTILRMFQHHRHISHIYAVMRQIEDMLDDNQIDEYLDRLVPILAIHSVQTDYYNPEDN